MSCDPALAGRAYPLSVDPVLTVVLVHRSLLAPPATPKVVIVGASGYTGTATVNAVGALVGAANVKVITRHPESATSTGFKSSGVHVVKGDYNDQASLVAAFAGAAAVYLIAPGSEVRGRLNPLLSVPVSGNRRIPRLVRRLRCVRFPFLA